MLFERHISAKMRRAGIKILPLIKRGSEDDTRLEKNLIKLIIE